MFHPTNIELNLQKIYLLKKLIDEKNGLEEAWESFKDIYCESDLDKKLLEVDKEYLIRIAKRQEWKDRPPVSFYITRKEIKFINSIDAPQEFRLFILGILIYAKYTKQQIGLPIVGTRERSYAYYLTNGTDEFNIGKHRSQYINMLLSKTKESHGLSFYPAATKIVNGRSGVPKTVISVRANWINWEADSGYLVKNLEKDALKLAKKIKNQEFVCSECGKKYFASTKSQTELCPECYKAKRRKEKTENDIKRYHNRKISDSNHPNIS